MSKKQKLPPGTWIERELFQSRAYLSLKGFAPQLLTLFLAKRQFETIGHKGKQKRICINCDQLSFTYIEADKRYGITKPRFSRALDELLAKGFIKMVYQGGTYKKDKSLYSLSDKWKLWQPDVVFEARKKRMVARGFCKPQRTKITNEGVPIRSNESVPKVGVLM